MLIGPNTKISAVIKNNAAAIDALIAVNSHFSKLKNPVLRKVLAPRVTVSEAAKIGNCSVETILNSLKEIGFEIEHSTNDNVADIQIERSLNHYDELLDVREGLANGIDPFQQILKMLEKTEPGKTLLIVNTFEPIPLIKILKAKGFEIFVSSIEPGLVHTYITKGKVKFVENKSEVKPSEEPFDVILCRYKDKMVEIDVRELEMPKPMHTILAQLEQLPAQMALYVLHKKIPVYLLPELQDRGFSYVVNELPDKVLLIIYWANEL